ncbi:MAG: class I tRNA ligase family protein, partial [Gemmataceae bacterium]
YLDRIKIKNPRTGNLMHRVPDVGNPWLDAGVVAFSTLNYRTDPGYWAQWYPADFITESFPGQFRNWFYSLLAMSTMLGDGKPPFKTLLGFATVRDQFGKEMHKSEGNSIEFIGAANDGYELFVDLPPEKPTADALKLLPKGTLSTREELTTDRDKKPVKRVFARYKPIGADVIRWLFCRQSPAANLNFGPEPTDEVRAKFILKLWNVYALFSNYASADGYDPTAPAVPLAERPAIDRWILSDLQELIRTARTAYESYSVQSFALAAEAFIDEKLSNWYVRRNRDRFWSKNADLNEAGRQDKLAAYQTLHSVLRTLCQVLAPCVPFLSEVLWQNLRNEADEKSVHLTDFPQVDEAAIDTNLAAEMDAVLRIVSLGGAARNAAKQKVRQPLAELRVQPASDADRRAVQFFADLIQDELNVKTVTLAEANLLTMSAKLNKKTAAAKLGPNLKAAEGELAGRDLTALRATLKTAPVELAGVALESADFEFSFLAAAGWAGVEDKGTQVAIDGQLTTELKREGLARDVIRLVQDARKNLNLNLADKIQLHLGATGELAAAIDTHRDAIATAVQAVKWGELPGGTVAKIETQELTIALVKAD